MVHAILGIRPAPAPEGGRSCEDSDAAASDQDIADASAPDRAALREARRGVPQPTIDDLLFDLDEPDPNARVVAVPKVGSLRPRETIEVLSNVFSRDNDPLVRSRAIAALTRLGGSDASRLLRERALEDDDPGLRMQALNALGEL
jgi:hypothetical protein